MTWQTVGDLCLNKFTLNKIFVIHPTNPIIQKSIPGLNYRYELTLMKPKWRTFQMLKCENEWRGSKRIKFYQKGIQKELMMLTNLIYYLTSLACDPHTNPNKSRRLSLIVFIIPLKAEQHDLTLTNSIRMKVCFVMERNSDTIV